ncbi:hypothetical protein DACRYDRAFT_90977 [Dacryopinax primogenitus]|uniref:CSN8/PSMD8/EIF3K domain-containing protein n=1 Tax=Dacryopinax primogenitus (strain DJM 731) TaxID=1858805 RepID=M5FSY2_DACPD|nr:uncharacterized protein DACRYDRAFT_90977 [Dacryopinax primogenitus]EJT98429.1 hypothetical protein DACRYDRAFT_90977 [Dacryopinax primogenitus]
MERLAMISRSGEGDSDNDTLKDYEVQQEFWEYIEEHINAYKVSNPFPPTLNDDSSSSLSSSQNETLTNILLMLRKLREGVLASHRVDSFAVGVYETSVSVAIYCQEDKALSSIFGRLVPELYDLHEDAELAAAFLYLLTTKPRGQKLSSPLRQRTPSRDDYTAVYLLHLLVTGYPSQRDFLLRSKVLLMRTSPHFQLVAATAANIRQGNYWALAQLVLHCLPTRNDLIQRMMVAILAKTRQRTWATLKVAYVQLQLDHRHWLCSALGFEKTTSVQKFMAERVKRGEVMEKEGKEPTWTIVKAAKGKT